MLSEIIAPAVNIAIQQLLPPNHKLRGGLIQTMVLTRIIRQLSSDSYPRTVVSLFFHEDHVKIIRGFTRISNDIKFREPIIIDYKDPNTTVESITNTAITALATVK